MKDLATEYQALFSLLSVPVELLPCDIRETETMSCCTGEDGTTELRVLNTVEHLQYL